MCLIHYWICMVCKHGFIRWTTKCDEMYPPLLHCPGGYNWEYMWCAEEDCCVRQYHPYAPPYLVGQGDYIQYVNGRPTGLTSHTSHASTQTEPKSRVLHAQTDHPAIGKVDASTMTSPRDTSVLSSTKRNAPIDMHGGGTSDSEGIYLDSRVQKNHPVVEMSVAGTMTVPQDIPSMIAPRRVKIIAPVSPPTTPFVKTTAPSISAARGTLDDYGDDNEDAGYVTAKETMDEEFTLVKARRTKNKKNNQTKNGKQIGSIAQQKKTA